MKKYIWIIIVIIFISSIAWVTFSAYAANQIRTTEVQIASSDVAISSSYDYPFTLYIGDDLSGVTAPLKSLTFNVSGVYTGGGSIGFSIDSDGATTQSFTLPSVSSPTPFEINYKDSSNKINPTTGGSYNYTLNFDPSGVTIYGLGIKMSETHKYVPSICPDGNTNQRLKTTENVVANSEVPVSSSYDYPFTLYIGDDLSTVTAPALKSLTFNVSGVYTGGGSIGFSLDNDGATTKSYTLPSVSVATPFEFNYKDPSNKINPTTGGSYNYTLNFNPSGVTIYGLGVKMVETHKYVPPSCGSRTYGDFISKVYDSADGTTSTGGAGYNSLMWIGDLNGGQVKFQFAASDSSEGPWAYIGGDTCQDGDWFNTTGPNVPVELIGTGTSATLCQDAWNNKRYFRYKVRICSDPIDCNAAGTNTPIVSDVIVNWLP